MLIQFNLTHAVASNAEAYNTTVAFYLPAYISYVAIVSNTTAIATVTQVDSGVFFNVSVFCCCCFEPIFESQFLIDIIIIIINH